MPFQQVFADKLQEDGLSIDAEAVPDRSQVDSDLERLTAWLDSLDEDTRAAIDEVTGENAVAAGLADPEVGIVENIGPLLSAYDARQSGTSISMMLEQLSRAARDAADAADQGETPEEDEGAQV